MTDYQLAHEQAMKIIADQRKAINELRAACEAALYIIELWCPGCRVTPGQLRAALANTEST